MNHNWCYEFITGVMNCYEFITGVMNCYEFITGVICLDSCGTFVGFSVLLQLRCAPNSTFLKSQSPETLKFSSPEFLKP